MLQVSCPEVDSFLVQNRMPLPWQVTIVAGLCQLLSHISLTPASWVDGIELMNIPLNALRAVLEEVDASGGTDFVSVTTANLEREEEAIETQSTFPSDKEQERLPKFSITLRCANACRIKLTFLAYKETKATSHAHDTTTDDQSLAQHLTAEQETCAHLCGLFAATSMFSGLRGLWLSDATWLPCVPPHTVLQFLPQLMMLVVDRVRDESSNAYCQSTTEAYDPRSILEGLKKGPDLTAPSPLLHTLAIFCGNDSPESDSDCTAAGTLAEVQEVGRSRAEEGCPLACVVAIRGDEMLQAAEYAYKVGCEEGFELVREYEGLVVVYQELKAKWDHLTH
ncbi:hypothetical protein C2E23DRAFT_469968 [Lenzites betulinus]|nr:hypothetical protein C2E23DRAFT_469968 [Lenzites betulinus]